MLTEAPKKSKAMKNNEQVETGRNNNGMNICRGTVQDAESSLRLTKVAWRRFQERPKVGLLLTNITLYSSCTDYLVNKIRSLTVPALYPRKLCLALCEFDDAGDENVWSSMSLFLRLSSCFFHSILLDFDESSLPNSLKWATKLLHSLGDMGLHSGLDCCLEELELVDMDFTGSENGMAFHSILTNITTLHALKLLGCRFNTESIRLMATGFQNSSRLKKLCLNSCALNGELLRLLVVHGLSHRQTLLHTLELTRNHFREPCVLLTLASLLKCQDMLETLDLSGIVGLFDDRAAEHDSKQFFNAIQSHPSLKTLALVGVRLGSFQARLLFSALEGRACPLQTLDLMHNGALSTRDGMWFDFMAKLKNLRHLFLPSISIRTDRVVQILSCNTSLIWLECGNFCQEWGWFLHRNRVIQQAKFMPKSLWPRAIRALLGKKDEIDMANGRKEGFFVFVLETHLHWIDYLNSNYGPPNSCPAVEEMDLSKPK